MYCNNIKLIKTIELEISLHMRCMQTVMFQATRKSSWLEARYFVLVACFGWSQFPQEVSV